MTSLSVIVPCCNEEDAVALLPERLFPVLFRLALRDGYEVELILVDDGSTDETWDRLVDLTRRELPFDVLLERHSENKGLGAALQTGARRAQGSVVATLDADGTYPFDLLEPLVESLREDVDVATVSPYHPDGGVEGVGPVRLLFSRGASMLYRILVDRSVHTYTAMVRVYRAPVLREAIPEEDGFLNVAQTLVEARRHGARIVEIPAVLRQREVGSSKARVFRITRAHLRYMSRLLWLRLTRRFWLPATEESRPMMTEMPTSG